MIYMLRGDYMTGRELFAILQSNGMMDMEIIIGVEGYVIDENDEMGVFTTKDNRILLADSCGYYAENGLI